MFCTRSAKNHTTSTNLFIDSNLYFSESGLHSDVVNEVLIEVINQNQRTDEEIDKQK